MPSYVSNLQHFVWSTFQREPWIDPEWQSRLFEYIGGIVRNRNSTLLCAGGMPDHVHLLISVHPSVPLSELVNVVKSNSSRWIHENISDRSMFRWQEKYGAFSVSKSNEGTIRNYISNQREHHRERSYRQEFLELLVKHEIDFDERYLWQ
ncbi:MAG: IS200/IS605 family transposase [Pirellulales bacterium]